MWHNVARYQSPFRCHAIIAYFIDVFKEFTSKADKFEHNADDKEACDADADKVHHFRSMVKHSGVQHVWRQHLRGSQFGRIDFQAPPLKFEVAV